MSIKHIDEREHDGTQLWGDAKNGGFIQHRSKATNYEDLYIMARLGPGTWWCEDRKGFVYNFNTLLKGGGGAPKYMATLARRAKRDLDNQQKETTND